MNLRKIEENGGLCAVLEADGPVITDARSALEVLMQSAYEAGRKNLAVPRRCISEDFFHLRTGLAGDILQKYINYGGRIAIYGDFSRYRSQALEAFIRESNRGRQVFFAGTQEEAVRYLTGPDTWKSGGVL